MAETRTSAELNFYRPNQRGVFDLSAIHVPRRLRRRLRQGHFSFAIDRDFAAVIAACADTPRAEGETWINSDIERAFAQLHTLGHAHCVSAYDGAGTLCGGLYGLHLGGMFFGESMFSRATDASKACFVALCAGLADAGFTLIDAQMENPHLAQFGLQVWSDEAFMAVLPDQLSKPLSFPTQVSYEVIERFVSQGSA